MKKFIILFSIATMVFIGSTAFDNAEMKSVDLVKLPDCKYAELFNPPMAGCTSFAQRTDKVGTYYTHIVNWSCGIYGSYNTYCTDQNPNMPTPPQED